MIQKDRSNLTVPDPKNPTLKEIQQRLLENRNDRDFDKYKSHFKVELDALKKHYKYKCGYCESHVGEGHSHLEIDHYRPRGKIKEDENHPGYYWLAYEWSNLVPVCSRCNKAKWYHFPIDEPKGVRVKVPPLQNGGLDSNACRADSKIHIAEMPLLLHPEIDSPGEHLTFLKDGRIEGKTQKGKTTIEICKLDRDALVVERKKLIDKFVDKITRTFSEFNEEKIKKDTLIDRLNEVFEKIKNAHLPHHPFSLLGRLLFDKFYYFFVEALRRQKADKLALKIAEAYSNFKKSGTVLARKE